MTVVLPAKEEEVAIAATLRALPFDTLRLMGYRCETFVLDGNSRDATARIAKEWGAAVVTDREPGKGAALRNALPLFHGDYIVMLDADGTYPADAIPAVLEPLARGEAEVAMGQRRALAGAMPSSHKVGNAALSVMASLLYGRRVRDVCTGLWAFRADALRRLPLRSQGFGLEAELFAWCSRSGLSIARVEVDYLPRQGMTKLHSLRDGWRITRRLLQARVVRADKVRSPRARWSASRPPRPKAEPATPTLSGEAIVAPPGGRP